ncbi:hypothetical protein QF050_001706 [Arthrobacter sp. SLBN-112]|nr:hypothetical protein [Arthrobacter sp. SLBN-112]
MACGFPGVDRLNQRLTGSITVRFVVTIRAMGRHWRKAPREYDFSVPLPRPQVLGYALLILLAACALATAAFALLRTS